MKIHHIIFFFFLLVSYSCSADQSAATQSEVVESVKPFTEEPTVLSEDTSVKLLELPTPVAGSVVFDFSERPCSASWSNNGEYLPCPGDLEDLSGGFSDRFDQVIIEGNILIEQPGLLTVPAQKESGFYAIFGKYPPFTVQAGDRFQAVLACANEHINCDVVFSLEYASSDNTIQQVIGAAWDKKYDTQGSYIYADVNLDALAGKTVQFLLTVRDNGDADDDYAVWIRPYIARPGDTGINETPSSQSKLSIVNLVNISGSVDMKSAPPYLYDDHPPGSSSAVVLFDLNSEMYYTIPTEPARLTFSLDVFPGQYYLLAYAQGIGDVPYVTGAYTGIAPSCGQPMAVLSILPDSPVTNILINDWNWSCGGNADRLPKPEEVPLP